MLSFFRTSNLIGKRGMVESRVTKRLVELRGDRKGVGVGVKTRESWWKS